MPEQISGAPPKHGDSHESGGYDEIDAALNPAAVALTTQGDILYHNGTALARLAAGTSGQFLKTQGAGANPVWADESVGKVMLSCHVRDICNDGDFLCPVGYMPNDAEGFNITENRTQIVVAIAGTCKNLYINVLEGLAAGKSITVTLRKNGVSQSLTVTKSDSNGAANDTTHTVSVAAGDLLCFLINETNFNSGRALMTVSMEITPS